MKNKIDNELFELFSEMGVSTPDDFTTEKILLKIREVENPEPIINPIVVFVYLFLCVTLPALTYFIIKKDWEDTIESNLILNYINALNFDYSSYVAVMTICIYVIVFQIMTLHNSKSDCNYS